MKIWASQAAGDGLERQLLAIAQVMMQVLRSPPQAGQNISEWAKQQACRKTALETGIPADPALDDFLVAPATSARRTGRSETSSASVTGLPLLPPWSGSAPKPGSPSVPSPMKSAC